MLSIAVVYCKKSVPAHNYLSIYNCFIVVFFMLHCFGYILLLLWSSCLLLSVAGAAAVVLAATWLLLVLFIIITVTIDDRSIMLPFFISYLWKIHTFFNTPIESPRVIWNKPKNNVTNLECSLISVLVLSVGTVISPPNVWFSFHLAFAGLLWNCSKHCRSTPCSNRYSLMIMLRSFWSLTPCHLARSE